MKKDRDGKLSFGEIDTNVKLFQREDKYYIEGLKKLLAKKSPIIYKNIPQSAHNLFDTLIWLRLVYIDDDGIVQFDRKNIYIWEKMYNKSMNWYVYFENDLKKLG